MMAPLPAAALAFTGGKDCTLALHLVQGHGKAHWEPGGAQQVDVKLLVVFAPQNPTFRAHPLDVIRTQAELLGLPLEVFTVEAPFLASYAAHLTALRERLGITHLVTGDILDVCERFMDRAAAGTGVELVRPLWHADRRALLDSLWATGIDARVSCVNLGRFSRATPGGGATTTSEAGDKAPTACGASAPSAVALAAAVEDAAAMAACGAGDAGSVDAEGEILGAHLDARLCSEGGALGRAHAAFGVDLCGEAGELHTMVVGCPMFRGRRLALETVKRREGEYAFLHMLSVQAVPA